MAAAVRVTTVATLSGAGEPFGRVRRHGQSQGGRHRDGCRLPASRHLDPEVLTAGNGQEEGRPGVPIGSSAVPCRDVRDARRSGSRASAPARGAPAPARCRTATATSPRASIDVRHRRARSGTAWLHAGHGVRLAGVVVVVPTLRQPATALRSSVRRSHGSRDRPRRRAATTTGSNCVSLRRSTSSSASGMGSAARSALLVVSDSNASATATIRAKSGMSSPARPDGIAPPVETLVVVLDAVQRRLEELDVTHDLRPLVGCCRMLASSASLRSSTLRRIRLGTPRSPRRAASPRSAGRRCRCGSAPSLRQSGRTAWRRVHCGRACGRPWSPPRPPTHSASVRARCSRPRTGQRPSVQQRAATARAAH